MRLGKDSWTLAMIIVFSQLFFMFAVMTLSHIIFGKINEPIDIGIGVCLGMLASYLIRAKLTGQAWQFQSRKRF